MIIFLCNAVVYDSVAVSVSISSNMLSLCSCQGALDMVGVMADGYHIVKRIVISLVELIIP